MAVLIGSAALLWQICTVGQWYWDYRKGPAAVTFEHVIGEPPPPGITNLRASGRGYALSFRPNGPHGKHWVWMSFDVTDAAVAELTNGLRRSDDSGIWRDRISANPRFDAMDRRAVGWDEVAHIQNPQTFVFRNYGRGTITWTGVLRIDPSSHRGYCQATGAD